jgi:hypothetical protein
MQETQSHAVMESYSNIHTRLYEIFLGRSPYFLYEIFLGQSLYFLASNSKLLQTNFEYRQGSFFILIGGLTIGLSRSNETFLNVLFYRFGF